jgi:hypothetical protein
MTARRLFFISLFVLPVIGFLTFNNAAYAFWMCEHPLYQSYRWQLMFYVWSGVTLAIVASWIFVLVMLLRRERRGK